jgi:hypothetical protein
MKYAKETTFEQLHELWVRMWGFMSGFIKSLDGDEVQDAIRSISDPSHPFYVKLKEALDTLKHKLESEISPDWVELKADARSPLEVFEDINKRRRDALCAPDSVIYTIRSWPEPVTSGEQMIRFLVFNQDLSPTVILQEVVRKGLGFPRLEWGIRFAEDYVRRMNDGPLLPFPTQKDCGLNDILFLYGSLESSMSFGVDSMGSLLLRRVAPSYRYRAVAVIVII